MKNAANGATYMTAAKITRIAARTRRWFVADNAMAERARSGPSTPSPNAESTLNQRASVGSASVSQANKNPSENCQIEKPATTMMTMRRTPFVLLGHSRMNDAIPNTSCTPSPIHWQKLTHCRIGFANEIANEPVGTARYRASQAGIVGAEMANRSTRLATG
jgi:hypothetical protein